ncbi:hypothetical protein GCM10010495_33470 [Kitasatospora herbaricolor]|uniref:hypothetical protein n=1 Tax=Kitasatospora herbaricolor TaxID=68217 RepID=UPI00174D07B8|nr:hypothetical protein [Kitasatospora herbaricolor]MDQ0307587.1 hypothetical protein [Kitasatospora herbaricolor]GGV16464.1 hypothetical protein GCM10010495_33470 [Kitasatospora herbaricolor]
MAETRGTSTSTPDLIARTAPGAAAGSTPGTTTTTPPIRTRSTPRALAAAALLASAALVLAGCSGGSTGSGPGAVRTAAAPPSATPPPVPTPTPTPYGPVLARWIGPLDVELAKLPQAADLIALGAALKEVSSKAVLAGAGLNMATEPTAVSAAHGQLVAALKALSAHIDTVQEEIHSGKYCATGSALARFGQAEALTTIPAALATLAAAGYPASLTVPPTGQLQQRALDNGAMVREGSLDGRGELSIENGGSGDAVLSLAKDGKSVHSIYVGKGQTAKFKGIEDGTYEVFFAGGSDWDPAAKAFTQDCDFSKFDEPLDFKTTRTSSEIRWSTWTLSLQAVVGGNARTTDVPAGSYPLP